MKKSNVFFCLGFLFILPIAVRQYLSINNQLVNTTAAIQTDCAKEVGVAKVVCLCEAFKATLNKDQVALLQLTYSKSNAVRWSNFPQAASRPNRLGLSLKSLTAVQRKAFQTLMGSVLSQNEPNEGLSEMNRVMAADDYFGKTTGKSDMFGSDNYFIAFLGTPSASQLWELQFGGHHFAFADTYNKGKIIGTTPSFRGVEPMKPITADGQIYQPIDQERLAFAAAIGALTDTQKSAAKLSATFSDIILGPGQDGNFPVKKLGLKISDLNTGQQKQILKSIELYVNDLDPVTAKATMKKYTAELPDTYISYSGTGKMDQNADYIRIDGPGVWIEYDAQPSRDFPGTTHPHSVWRDHQSDYGGN